MADCLEVEMARPGRVHEAAYERVGGRTSIRAAAA